MATDKLRKELDQQLPGDFDRPVEILTEKLDVLDLIDSTSKASRSLASRLIALPNKALLAWRPPHRGWSVWVPTGELEDIDYKYRLQHDDWSCVPLAAYIEVSMSMTTSDKMSYDEAVNHYQRWTEERSLSPNDPIRDLSSFIDGKWYLENEDGIFASVDEYGDVWHGDSPYLDIEEFRALALKHGWHAFKKPPAGKATNPTIATGTDEYDRLFVRITQGDQTCEITLPELKEILKAVADARKTAPGSRNIFESSTARLDALGKYQRRTVTVRFGDDKVNIDVGESGLDEMKDTSVILPSIIGQITSGKVTVGPVFLKSVVKAVEKLKLKLKG
jgi:hypothetical protein